LPLPFGAGPQATSVNASAATETSDLMSASLAKNDAQLPATPQRQVVQGVCTTCATL
jgi:hypothetical protein